MTKIFKLVLNLSRENDLIYDATLRTFDGSEKLRYYFLDPNMYSTDLIPETLFFDADFKLLSDFDFPFTDSRIFIINRKVKNVIDRFIDFKFHVVPITMFDETFLDDRFDADGKINSSVPINNEFVALRFPELKSYFDFENSEYRVPKHNPKGVRGIKKIVLTEKEHKFPAIFSTREKATTIFVREDLKLAIENVGFTGCTFEQIETTGQRIE